MLGRIGAPGATLIISGPLTLTPLHAATWHQTEEEICLLDKMPIRYAPSASLQGKTIERSARASSRRRHLVALGNPEGADLPASEAEVNEIAKLFDAADVGTGAQATSTFFRAHAATATHLHFACHGRGSPLGFGESAIMLADGEISAEQVPTLEKAPPRLTVISACQTAITNVELGDEVFSISMVLLAAGSACVVASLWPVDDFATALLMTHFYERLFAEGGVSPPQALRVAQLWLRQLTADGEAAYLAEHPTLEQAFQTRTDAANLPGRRGENSPAEAARPYDHPEFWAAFIVVGA